MKKFYPFILFGLVFISMVRCAKRGTPTGGDDDITPPKLIRAEPPLLSTNFKSKRIRLYFNEYIKLKNIRKQLIVSPLINPADYTVTPLSGASKYIQIDLRDSLMPNTTYAFNFGESVVDNNEENPFPYFQYVFSTGDYIDSLQLRGTLSDALNRKPDEYLSVMLYELDSTFSDSVVYQKNPDYITNTLDSNTTYQLNHLRAGKYLLVALKDLASNYRFDQITDKIGFHTQYVDIPNDSIVDLVLSQETPDFKSSRPYVAGGQRLGFGFQGKAEQLKIELKTPVSEGFESILTPDTKTDTLYYWYKYAERDSLVFKDTLNFLVNDKTYSLKMKSLPNDSLVVQNLTQGTLALNGQLQIKTSTPLVAINPALISLRDKDSVSIDFEGKILTDNQTLAINFEILPNETYQINLLPGALRDFFEAQNDSLQFLYKTKSRTEYGAIRLQIFNPPTLPFILELTDEKYQVKRSQYVTSEESVYSFEHIEPGKYYVRLIEDSNKNGIWDPGRFLDRLAPERVYHYKPLLDVRANWDLQEIFDVNQAEKNPDHVEKGVLSVVDEGQRDRD